MFTYPFPEVFVACGVDTRKSVGNLNQQTSECGDQISPEIVQNREK